MLKFSTTDNVQNKAWQVYTKASNTLRGPNICVVIAPQREDKEMVQKQYLKR